MKKIIFLLILVALIIGCDGNKITGQATLDLTSSSIKDGETTTIKVNGKNTGNTAAEVMLKVTSEKSEKLFINYPGSLEFTLQPGEDTGTKIIKVTGYTDYSSTKYWIKTQLINKADGSILDEEIEWITVNK